MKRVLIVGAGEGGSILFKLLHRMEKIEIVAMIDKNENAIGLNLARKYHIPTDKSWEYWMDKNIDIILEATGDEAVLENLREKRLQKTVVIPGSVAQIISELFNEKEVLLEKVRQQSKNQELILSHIRDGMIIIDQIGRVQFVNKSAEEIIGLPKAKFEGKFIQDIIDNTRLLNVLKTKEKDINQRFLLKNGKQIIVTRIPVINDEGVLIGAFAVFKDITEVIKLAEENTDLNDIKEMLEAIIQSSDDAISVVDEHGNGLIINPAYSRITGLTEKDVIGKPATADITEGESMHMKVLETGESFRGVRMKVGPNKKDVLVNVAPIIVKGKIRGSVGVIHDVSEITSLTSELKRARQIIRKLEANYTFDDIIGESPEMNLAKEQAKVGAKTPATVLIRGESGTGKELFAHAIHNESDRKFGKFIRVNCASIAESLIESELFGYEAGAFSGAKAGGKIGLFEEANNGSIFLDEIGELSLSVQAKLLRVLQEGEIIRVGGTKPIKINARVIAATNINLEKAIMTKTFREDLYYRLTRLPIFIPPLRERKTDIPYLVEFMIQKLNQDYGRNVQGIDEDALHKLKRYDWPGNVRELENMIGRAMIFMDSTEVRIRREHIPTLHVENSFIKPSENEVKEYDTLQKALERYEKDYIYHTYRANNWNKTKTAQSLQISIRTLYYKLKKHNLE